MSNQCVFYDQKLQKQIPCLITNQLNNINNELFVKITFDSSRFSTFNTNIDELLRYSTQFHKLIDVYPSVTSEQQEYNEAVMPKKFARTVTPYLTTSSHNTDELNRFESLINMITDVVSIDSGIFSNLVNLVMYRLFLTHCNETERDFIMTLSNSQLTEQPTVIYAPQIIRMLKQIFSVFSFTSDTIDLWKIVNFQDITEFESLTPFKISLINLRYNVNFIIL